MSTGFIPENSDMLDPNNPHPDRTRTQSLCPVCLARIPAKRVHAGESVFLEKNCPRHGAFRTLIWQGPPAFDDWRRAMVAPRPPAGRRRTRQGCPFDCGLCEQHRQRSCTVILEVTQRCDLGCAVCYADSRNQSQEADAPPDRVKTWFRQVRKTAGDCNIQLSGGEPTLRDDLPRIIAAGRDEGFDFIQLNTNGLRLGRERDYATTLQQAGLSSVFLQFDGTEDLIYRRLRGRPLLAEKRAAIEACAEQSLGVVLVPTLVPGVNTNNIGAILELAMHHAPAVRGVHFQPVSYFGRHGIFPDPAVAPRLTLPHVMQAIEAQSNGVFRIDHLHPPSCENALCSFHGRFLLMPGGKVIPLHPSAGSTCCDVPVHAETGAARAIASAARQWSGAGRPLHSAPPPDPGGPSCCGDAANPSRSAGPMGLDDFIARARTHTFSISGMAFQDAWTLALDRVRECCIHLMAPGGGLVPFCLYNLSAADGRTLYR
jgi:uncharacterized radical SAM superfamily Fe-S cluster-containing enzyme